MEVKSRLFVVLCVWVLSSGAFAQQDRSPSAPLGVAPYIELEREAFLMGLFVPAYVTSAQEVINTSGSRAMEFKFTADRMTAGKLSRLFLQSIAINASPQLQRDSANSLASFFNTLKGSLRTGDVLTLSEKTDASGVVVYLNGHTLADIEDPNFFNLLLLGWIGSVPPSTDFKAALLGQSNPADVERFRQIEPSPERSEAVAAWLEPMEEKPAETTEIEPVAAPTELATSSQPASDSAVSEAALASVAAVPEASAPIDVPVLAAAPVAQPVATPTNTPVTTLAATETDVAPEPTLEQAEASTSSAATARSTESESANRLAQSEKADEAEEDLPNFSAESLHILQDYTAQLVQLTHAHIKYPRRAMKLQQTGSVRMAVVINAEGELIDMQPLLESGYKQLDDAVEKAIEKSAPYPAIPKALRAEHFEFVFPITFMLEKS
ncbi:TonB family protein [Gilvimarinus chinensis]|uniref:TonB family protein n=1 Tax=Gilvimarinus chinensis TaxID=396005 RepID=UPI00037F4D23|nr:TonB family protein [Gilvimarinus chinensis]